MNFLLQVRSYLTTHVREIVRFVVVGISIFLINFLTFAFVHYKIGLDYPAAATAGYGVGIICHFTLNKLFTFEAGTQVLAQNLPRYALMLAFNYGITLVAFWLTVRIIAAPAHFGVVVASASTAFSSFFVMKYFVFQPASAGRRPIGHDAASGLAKAFDFDRDALAAQDVPACNVAFAPKA